MAHEVCDLHACLRIFHIYWRHILPVPVNQYDLILARVGETKKKTKEDQFMLSMHYTYWLLVDPGTACAADTLRTPHKIFHSLFVIT